jgi:hypothetical protein
VTDDLTPQAMEAAEQIIARYPELESTNIELLKKLIALGWIEGRLAALHAQLVTIEASLGLS